MAYQLTVANCPSQVPKLPPPLRVHCKQRAAAGCFACGLAQPSYNLMRTTLGRAAPLSPPQAAAAVTAATAASPAAATFVTSALPGAAATVQDLAKTNRVFVSPRDPAAAIPYVQLGDL